jgi:Putative endonuclease, protein of unknown function (DUF1780)
VKMPKWKREQIESLEQSIAFFGNEGKWEREKWVVERLLEALSVVFDDGDLQQATEPADVKFGDAKFQVKEVMDPRQRQDEYRQQLERTKKAKTRSDLTDQYSPKDVALSEIVERCVARSVELRTKYGPKERRGLDLVCYFNFKEYHEGFSAFAVPSDHEFRSLSVVSNSFRVVLYAQADAPDLLRDNVGKVFGLDGQTVDDKKG